MSWGTPPTWTNLQLVGPADLQILSDDLNDLNRRATLLQGYIQTSETTTSTTYAALATAGPSVTATVGASGLVLVAVYANISNSLQNGTGLVGVDVSGATTQAASDGDALAYQSCANAAGSRTSAVFPLQLTPGSNTFTLRYRVTANTGTFSDRRIAVIPLSA